ncbi:MAG: triphosphoribosyl-dephospho-CoA synthase [Planctomycetes bacterium]|nr:triphosphoribosyl-dephospho-CoA synthase [Planctomycetota bacterium]
MADIGHHQLERAIRQACLMEATARKPGNVHPDASFHDLTYADFVASADAAAPILARSRELGVGRAVLDAVSETRRRVASNTNLGIALLIAPLAAVDPARPLAEGIRDVLNSLSRDDAAHVYAAIREARAGGLGRVAEHDISDAPSIDLLEAMRLAADRDAVAEQYATGFQLVLERASWLASRPGVADDWEPAIIELHLRLMAHRPDTLIARKCGTELAQESARRAAEVLKAGGPHTPAGRHLLEQFDQWLRADGNRRNPGTTADLVAACLFAALREETIPQTARCR